MKQIQFSVDQCVVCGAIVEEGRWVCTVCEKQWESAPKPVQPKPVQEQKPKKIRWFCRKKAKQ